MRPRVILVSVPGAPSFSVPERVILALLICASILGFWWRLRGVVAVIAASKRDADFHLGSIPGRIRVFVREVLLQGKVIRQRPLAGLTHALVFWGFCAFGFITVNHIATGFGFPLLSRQGGFGRAYFGFVAVFAAVVAISISYLAARRFIAHPIWLGKVSAESGIIALLIFLLMVSYLGGLYWPETS
ncbi:MAG TPA: hypothetical protein VG345_11085, partial [Bryobacteraceae bacterium]|nr:hypothetical protein [Bryobacteraceae bacterium]